MKIASGARQGGAIYTYSLALVLLPLTPAILYEKLPGYLISNSDPKLTAVGSSAWPFFVPADISLESATTARMPPNTLGRTQRSIEWLTRVCEYDTPKKIYAQLGTKSEDPRRSTGR